MCRRRMLCAPTVSAAPAFAQMRTNVSIATFTAHNPLIAKP